MRLLRVLGPGLCMLQVPVVRARLVGSVCRVGIVRRRAVRLVRVSARVIVMRSVPARRGARLSVRPQAGMRRIDAERPRRRECAGDRESRGECNRSQCRLAQSDALPNRRMDVCCACLRMRRPRRLRTPRRPP